MRSILFLVTLVAACIGGPDPAPVLVGVHEEPLIHNYYATTGSDRICLHSTNNLAQGTKRWICGNDRVPVDVTAADVVNVFMDTGNDQVVTRGTSPARGGCNCSCDVNTGLYGAVIDYIYPDMGTSTKNITVVDSPIAVGTNSGNDDVFSGGGPQGLNSVSGINWYRGATGYDNVTSTQCGTGSACGAQDMIWDPAGEDGYWVYEGNDWITDLDCDWVNGSSAGDGTDTCNNCSPLPLYCENKQSLGPKSCPALPFP